MNLSCIQVFHFVFDGQPKVDIFWGDPSQLLQRATRKQSCLHHLALTAVALLQALVAGFCQTSLHSHAMWLKPHQLGNLSDNNPNPVFAFSSPCWAKCCCPHLMWPAFCLPSARATLLTVAVKRETLCFLTHSNARCQVFYRKVLTQTGFGPIVKFALYNGFLICQAEYTCSSSTSRNRFH